MDHQVDAGQVDECRAERGGVGGVGGYPSRSEFVGGGAQRVGASGGQDDVVTALHQCASAGLPDAAATAGDECGAGGLNV